MDASIVRKDIPMSEFDMKERAAFFAMIRADPGNNDTRLVFADWCEEHGDMELAQMLRGGSERWLRNFADELSRANAHDAESYTREQPGDLPYDELMKAVHAYLDTGEPLDLGMAASNLAWDETEEFWKHFEVMTGRAASSDQKEATFFSCSC
jgi:uncharacterized protein (TIGR02996 family)